MSNSSTKKEVVSSWRFPSFVEGDSVDVDIAHVKAPTAGDLEKLQEQAMQEASKKGYEEGLAKGLRAAEAQISQQVKSLESVVQSLVSPYEEFDERVENEIASLAIQISKQLIRRELKPMRGRSLVL